MTRDYNAEYQDGARKYAYEFDTLLRRYMMRTLDTFLLPGRALEMGCYLGDVTEMLAARYTDLTVIDVAARRVTKRLTIGRAAGIQMQPDGARAYVANTPDNSVAVIDLKSLEVVGRIDAGRQPDGLAWAVRH